MPIKRVKDRTNLLDTFKLLSKRRPHYVRVYIWRTPEDILANTLDMPTGTWACHCPAIWTMDPDVGEWKSGPLLGEVHFAISTWSTEIIAHEMAHALFHRIRTLGPDVARYQTADHDFDEEEALCYEFGKWYYTTHKHLWTIHTQLNGVDGEVKEES